jgi:hypothetical protein
MRALLAGIVLFGFMAASASACGVPKGAAAPPPPAVGTELAAKLKAEKPTSDAVAKATDILVKVNALVADQKVDQARALEEEGLQMLGYRKTYLRCGNGDPVWMKWNSPGRVTTPRPRTAS